MIHHSIGKMLTQCGKLYDKKAESIVQNNLDKFLQRYNFNFQCFKCFKLQCTKEILVLLYFYFPIPLKLTESFSCLIKKPKLKGHQKTIIFSPLVIITVLYSFSSHSHFYSPRQSRDCSYTSRI